MSSSSHASTIVNLCDDEAEDAAALAQVMELGISRDTAVAALKLSQGNVERAIEHVFAEPPAADAGGTITGSAMFSSSGNARPEALRQCRSCETYAAADSMQILEACNHMLCRQCLRPLQQQQLEQPTHPVCPARSCSRPLAIRDLALLLPPRALETLQSSALANFKQRLAEGFQCKQCSTVLQPAGTSSNGKGKRSAAAAAAAAANSTRTVAELQVKHMLTCRCGRTACCACRESIAAAAAAAPSTHSCTYSNLAVLLQLLTELELLVPDPDSTTSANRRAASSSTAAAAAAAATTSKAPAAKRAKAKAAAPPKPANTWAWGSPFSYASGIPASVFTGAIYDDYGKLTTIYHYQCLYLHIQHCGRQMFLIGLRADL
jgi:UBA/TS-N domain